jgi:hypothetical protein
MSRFWLLSVLALAFTIGARAQSHAFDGARSLVERVQTDLRQVQVGNIKDRERCEKAEHHLSDFDRGLAAGKFHKGSLSDAIGDVKEVLDHNTLEPNQRDAVGRDLADLRVLRERHGAI